MEIRDPATFCAYWENIRARTERVVELIPGDAFDWTHADGAWTFADIVRHLAGIERWMFAENVRGRPSRYPGCGPELADGREAVLEYLRGLHDEATAIFRGLTSREMNAKCETPGGVRITAWKWLRAMVEHEVHHRGQLYLMLGVLGVDTPPLYGLTEEQVRERSAS